MYGYIYVTTNLVNGKKYIGQKTSSIFLGEKYLGSGALLNKAIRKYSRVNFEVELLEECNSREELNEREKYWISYYDAVNSDKYYNIASGGEDGDTVSKLSKDKYDSYKYNISKSLTRYHNNHPGILNGSNNPMYGRIGENNPNTGSKRSEETKRKISESNKGKTISDKQKKIIGESVRKRYKGTRYINNGKAELRIPADNAQLKVANEGFVYGRLNPVNIGRKLSEESRRKIGDANRGKKVSKETREKIAKASSELHKGRHYINNGKITKKVYSSDIDFYLNNGWSLGMKKRKT